ncbi:hypothetical protein JYT83_01020 [bacterium AH-315-F18]|nr:hypothetical protein [bacterium AH-315-F18]
MFRVALLCLVLCAAPLGTPPDSKRSVTADWQSDGVCRFFYFAIVEGLFRDGVPNKVVDSVLGDKGSKKPELRENFVFKCKLCHAVYDAFSLYRNRPNFKGSEQSTFKYKVIDPSLLKRLENSNPETRIGAIMALAKPWIVQRIEDQKFTPARRLKFRKRLGELIKEGVALTKSGSSGFMKGWGSTCWACEFLMEIEKNLGKGKDKSIRIPTHDKSKK